MSQPYGTGPYPGYPQQDRMTDGQFAPSGPVMPSPYAAPNAGYSYPPVPPTNTLAIVALVCAVLGFTIIPIILGHIALGQVRERREAGRGLAIAALVIGYVELALVVGILAFVFGGLLLVGAAAT